MHKQLIVEGYRFAIAEEGDGEPIIFVHGSFDDLRTWLPQIRTFGKDARAICYSRRYHWPNEAIAEGADYSMDQHVSDLAGLIETLGIQPVRLVGHSYGGFVSLLLAIRRPDLVSGLALAEPPVVTLFVSDPPKVSQLLGLAFSRPRAAMTVVRFGAGVIEPTKKLVQRGELEQGLAYFASRVLGEDRFRHLPDERLEQIRQNLIPAEFLGSGFSALEDAWICNIEVPVLLLGGDRSPRIFRLLLDRLEELLPNSTRALIPGASHLVHEDSPAAFEHAVRQAFTAGA